MSRQANQAEVDAVLTTIEAKHVRFVNLEFTDVIGMAKCVTIPVEQFPDCISRGKWFDGSAIEGFARVAESDMYLFPDLVTFTILPDTVRPYVGMANTDMVSDNDVVARVICDVRTPDGERFDGDPRATLFHALQVAEEMGLPRPPKQFAYRPISLEPVDGALFDALARLVRLIAEPALISALAPLIRREITIRLLAGPHGPHLLHVVAAGSPSQQIAKVMSWLKLNFHRTLRMDELATGAHMSPSTFRQHFRDIAGMSPLQYQKQLRLQEARQLMLNEKLDASVAGMRVGYESVSQFSREYSRLFGAPPQRDIRRLRLSP